MILKGPLGRQNSLAKSSKPLQGLSKENLLRELSARGIYDGDKKKEMGELLKEEMHAVQRVPALFLITPQKIFIPLTAVSTRFLDSSLCMISGSTLKTFSLSFLNICQVLKLLN